MKRNLMKVTSLTIIMLLLLTLLGACTPKDDSSDTTVNNNESAGEKQTTTQDKEEAIPGKTSLIIMSAMPTDTFDPFPKMGETPETQFAEAQLARDSVAMNMVYSHLLKFGKDNEFLPDIATEWDLTDENTITFTIRTDAKFSDGTPLTVDDVIFSMESYQNSIYGMMSQVPFTSVEKISDSQIKVGRLTPYSKTLEFIASSISIVSKAAYTKEGGKESYQLTPIGSGPYIVDTINDAGDITFKRFDDYYAGKTDFETIVLRKPISSAAAVIELTAGTLDVLFNVSASDKITVENNSSLMVTSVLSDSTSFMALRGEKYANKDFREAIALAIDKESLVAFTLEGEGVSANKIIADQLLGDLAAKVNGLPGYDVEKAKDKLNASGVNKDETYTILTDGGNATLANAIKSNLTEIGLTNVVVETVDTQTLYGNLQLGQYEMAFWAIGYRNQALEDAVSVFATARKAPNGSPYNWLYGGETDVINMAYQQMTAAEATKQQRDEAIVTIINDVQSNFSIIPLTRGYSFAILSSELSYELPTSEYSSIYVGDIKNK